MAVRGGKKKDKENRDRVSRVYAVGCHGVEISIWDMGKIMDVGLKAIEEGADDATLEAKLVAFVETIRKN